MSYETAKALLNRGVSRPTLYSVELPRITREASDYLNFFCQATSIPRLDLETAQLNGQEHMGITRQQPTSMVFGKPFTMTVIENSDFLIYKEIRRWMDLTTQNANQTGGIAGTFGRSQRMNYYNTFVSDFRLTKLEQLPNQQGIGGGLDPNEMYAKPLEITFLNAYPVSIDDITLGSDMYNTMTTFDVSFTYESYSVSGFQGLAGQLLNNIGIPSL